MSARRALVTGGAGFIGSHLVRTLIEDGWSVRVLDDFSSGHESNLAPVAAQVDLRRADVRDPQQLTDAADGVDVIFHQAAAASVPASIEDPITSGAVNVEGTLRALEAVRHGVAGRLVFASSCALYGDAAPIPCREDGPTDPRSPYAVQKWSAETYCRIYADLHGAATVALRYFNVYGPRQDPEGPYAAVVPRFVAACRAGEAPQIHGDGSQTRDFLYVEDVARANILAAGSAAAVGRALNVASGVETSIRELAEGLAELAGVSQDPVYSPARSGDVRRSVGDPALARELLGFEPHVGLREGLRRTLAA
jgi:nucleoside-diphosphate-sugar epimerase